MDGLKVGFKVSLLEGLKVGFVVGESDVVVVGLRVCV